MNSTTANNSTVAYNPTANNSTAGDGKIYYYFGTVIAIFVVCTFCNGLVIAAYFIEKSIRSNANMLVVNLAFADLLFGLVLYPLQLLGVSRLITVEWKYSVAVDIFGASVPIFNCAILSIERALNINFPFWYTNNVTKLKVKITIVVVWVAAIVVSCLTFTREEANSLPYITFLAVVTYIIPVGVVIISYVSIFWVAQKHARSIWIQKRRVDCTLSHSRLSEFKIAWRLSIFIFVLIACWTLNIAIIMSRPGTIPIYLNTASTLSTYITAAINPFLYGLCNPMFRKGMMKLLKKTGHATCWKSKPSHSNGTSTTNTNFQSPSNSRVVSQCSPQMERLGFLRLPGDGRTETLNATNMKQTNGFYGNCELHETSL